MEIIAGDAATMSDLADLNGKVNEYFCRFDAL